MATLRTTIYGPVFSLLFAATAWGVIWYPLRLLEQQGLAGIWVTLVMYAAALLVGLIWMRPLRRDLRAEPGTLLGILLAAGWCNTAFVLAVIEGEIVRVMLLFYLSPIWTVLFGRLILGERITPHSFLLLGIACGGAVFMLYDPVLGIPLPRGMGDWLGLSAGIGFAAANVMARRGERLAVASKTFATWVGGVVVAGAWILLLGVEAPTVGPGPWVWALLLGAVGIVLMTITVIHGVSSMPVQRSATILLVELVAATVSAQLLTDEVVKAREWIGGSLIVIAAYWASRRG